MMPFTTNLEDMLKDLVLIYQLYPVLLVALLESRPHGIKNGSHLWTVAFNVLIPWVVLADITVAMTTYENRKPFKDMYVLKISTKVLYV